MKSQNLLFLLSMIHRAVLGDKYGNCTPTAMGQIIFAGNYDPISYDDEVDHCGIEYHVPDGDFCGPQRLYANAWASAVPYVGKAPGELYLYVDGELANYTVDQAEVWQAYGPHLKPGQRIQACLRYGRQGTTYLRVTIVMNPT